MRIFNIIFFSLIFIPLFFIVAIPLFLLLLPFIVLFFIFYAVFFILLPSVLGAPYIPASRSKVKKMVELAELKGGEILYDLGSGDGRIIIEAAKKADIKKAIGIELNPILVYFSRQKIKKLGLQKKVEVRWGNVFKTDLSNADVIFTYLLQPATNKLEKKALSELKEGARVVSLAFEFKKIPLARSDHGVKLYQIP